MIAMAVEYDWISVKKAAELSGCSEQYIRKVLGEHLDESTSRTSGGRLEGWKPNGRAWLVSRKSAVELSKTATTRARKHADSRASAKKKRKK